MSATCLTVVLIPFEAFHTEWDEAEAEKRALKTNSEISEMLDALFPQGEP